MNPEELLVLHMALILLGLTALACVFDVYKKTRKRGK